jgi:glycosyltransferase involved in cell wall biosynthesis
LYESELGVVTSTAAIGIERPEVAVLMPVHNEADIIENVVLEFYETVGRRIPVEIVLSEDGSVDGTKDVIMKLSKKVPLEAVLSPSRKGYAGGIKDGLKLVRAEYVLITDSDGQHTAEDFWRLWSLREKYDIVSGWRVERADSFYRRVISKTFQLMAKMFLNTPSLRDVTAPYKLMRTEVARSIAEECKYMRESFWTEFTIRACSMGASICEVPVAHRKRNNGATNVYKPYKMPKIVFSQFRALVKLRGIMEKADC